MENNILILLLVSFLRFAHSRPNYIEYWDTFFCLGLHFRLTLLDTFYFQLINCHK